MKLIELIKAAQEAAKEIGQDGEVYICANEDVEDIVCRKASYTSLMAGRFLIVGKVDNSD